MITCIHQRNGLTYFDVPVQKSLLDIVCNRLQYGSTIFTDEYRAYDQLEEHGLVHKSVNHSQKEYVNGIIHMNNCECRSNLYQLWIRKFMCVNKYNLQTYSKTFEFIHNNRTKTREQRFIHKSVNHSQKEYANGTIHVNNCECRSNLYQLWIRKFMGVNKYNLQTYSKTFQFIHNNKRTKTREERFMEILCCQ